MPLPFADRPIPTAADLERSLPVVAAAIAGAAQGSDEPYAPGKQWTRRTLAWHIVDTEAAMANRLCRILAEDRPVLVGIPQDIWAAGLPQRRDPAIAAEWFRVTRRMVVDLLRELPAAAWKRTGIHSEYGAMRLADVLRHLHEHALHHADQLAARGPVMIPGLRLDAGGGITLRDAIDADIMPLFAIIDRERDRLGRFLGWVADTRSADDVRAYFRSQQQELEAARVRHLTILADDRLVGRISLEDIKRTEKKALIGYWLSAAVEGRGVMTRALLTVCDHAFGEIGLERLSLFTHPDNHRSQAVARRCGFRQEGVFRRAALLNGQWVDQVWFARLRDDPLPETVARSSS